MEYIYIKEKIFLFLFHWVKFIITSDTKFEAEISCKAFL